MSSRATPDERDDTIRSALSLPPEAFSYLSSHGSLDIEHVAFFEKLMNRLDSTADQRAVVHVARMMYRLYGDVFRSLPRGAQLFDQAA
jgi:hypothetical protein